VECTYLCGVLNNTFIKTYNLKVHECVHIGECPYRCDGCNETVVPPHVSAPTLTPRYGTERNFTTEFPLFKVPYANH